MSVELLHIPSGSVIPVRERQVDAFLRSGNWRYPSPDYLNEPEAPSPVSAHTTEPETPTPEPESSPTESTDVDTEDEIEGEDEGAGDEVRISPRTGKPVRQYRRKDMTAESPESQ